MFLELVFGEGGVFVQVDVDDFHFGFGDVDLDEMGFILGDVVEDS